MDKTMDEKLITGKIKRTQKDNSFAFKLLVVDEAEKDFHPNNQSIQIHPFSHPIPQHPVHRRYTTFHLMTRAYLDFLPVFPQL